MIKVFYYIWAFAGGYLYFNDVRFQSEDSEVKALGTTLLVLTIINIVDVIRCALIVLLFVMIHVICKRRVRSQRQ